jgi:hypothetical protein
MNRFVKSTSKFLNRLCGILIVMLIFMSASYAKAEPVSYEYTGTMFEREVYDENWTKRQVKDLLKRNFSEETLDRTATFLTVAKVIQERKVEVSFKF